MRCLARRSVPALVSLFLLLTLAFGVRPRQRTDGTEDAYIIELFCWETPGFSTDFWVIPSFGGFEINVYFTMLLLAAYLPMVWVFSTLYQMRRQTIREKRRRAGRCSRCNYDLRASSGRCPECGVVEERSDAANTM